MSETTGSAELANYQVFIAEEYDKQIKKRLHPELRNIAMQAAKRMKSS